MCFNIMSILLQRFSKSLAVPPKMLYELLIIPIRLHATLPAHIILLFLSPQNTC